MAPGRGETTLTAIQSADELTAALQELRALRPLLRDAAEYAEAAYLRSDQKEVELGNVRDYAVSMLVTLVDRLGTVAHKVANEAAHQGSQLEVAELHVTSLQQRLQACWEYSGRDGLNRLQERKGVPRMLKSYTLPDAISETREEKGLPSIIRETFDFGVLSPGELSSESETSPVYSPKLTTRGNEFSTSWTSEVTPTARRPNILPLLSLSENTAGYDDSHSRDTLNCLSLSGQFAHTSPPSNISHSNVGNSMEFNPQRDSLRPRSKNKVFARQRDASVENMRRSNGSGSTSDDYITASGSPGSKKKSILGGIFGRRRARSVPISRENTVTL